MLFMSAKFGIRKPLKFHAKMRKQGIWFLLPFMQTILLPLLEGFLTWGLPLL